MSELDRGTDRVGRRRERFLSPSQKYEIYLQLGASGGDGRVGGGPAGRSCGFVRSRRRAPGRRWRRPSPAWRPRPRDELELEQARRPSLTL